MIRLALALFCLLALPLSLQAQDGVFDRIARLESRLTNIESDLGTIKMNTNSLAANIDALNAKVDKLQRQQTASSGVDQWGNPITSAPLQASPSYGSYGSNVQVQRVGLFGLRIRTIVRSAGGVVSRSGGG